MIQQHFPGNLLIRLSIIGKLDLTQAADFFTTGELKGILDILQLVFGNFTAADQGMGCKYMRINTDFGNNCLHEIYDGYQNII